MASCLSARMQVLDTTSFVLCTCFLHDLLLLQPFEMDERAVFLRFELFAKRLNKLISMFTTVHQFSSLEQHTHIAGNRSCVPRFKSYTST